ncbi:hypothetical protein Cgig2_012302 [Carnegiea gigantea]|uniref:Reverse transcriptase domain-containing protein n=1 Tax=Carnegiea gigantea TaxID=171969 RepID=A0A9Q1K1W9_9CARY|nr:hypothetical protein Cgig2_012302 [Carnegiea gigantea]
MEVKDHPMLKRPPSMTLVPKLYNARKYCEFHKQNGHTTGECRELRKALHELANKGQIDQFLKRGLRFLCKESEPTRPEPRDEECSTEIVAPSPEGTPRASLGLPGRLSVEEPSKFSQPKRKPSYSAHHGVRWGTEPTLHIFAQRPTGYRNKGRLSYLGREIVPLVHPILGFGGQEVNPTRMIRLPLCFGNKVEAKNLEVDVLVVDVLTGYNVILGRPTLHRVKAVIAPYLLQLQFEANDDSVGTMQGDQ